MARIRNMKTPIVPPRRKGSLRRSDIPPDVLRGLNEGRLETITLVEWLAIDGAALASSVLPKVGFGKDAAGLVDIAAALKSEGIVRRVKGLGEAIRGVLDGHKRGDAIFEALASHPADMARVWAAYSLAADKSHGLKERLALSRRFAADPHMSVRECAWDSIRPYVAAELKKSIRLLLPWARDEDYRIRRTAIEATRPRGVWCAHIEPLKKDPEPGLALLELVRSDPSDYVRRSAANWLNDASKSRPDWVRAVCERWQRESPTKETVWIVNHALRTLRKAKK